jgi:hypothetical protein
MSVIKNDAGAAFANIDSAKDLPVTVSQDRLNGIIGDDKDPYYFALTFPEKTNGTGGIYDGYHNSVAKLMRNSGKAIVGSATGHAPNGGIRGGFYFIGAKENDDKSVSYKGYVPPTGVGGGSNDWLKRLINSGNAEFSIVAHVTEGGDTQENGVPVYTQELDFPQIDLVEKGAQKQLVTNASVDFDKVNKLIADGAVDKDSGGKDILSGDRVSLSGVKYNAYHAKDKNTRKECIRILNAIKHNEEIKMDDETIAKLAKALASAMAGAAPAPAAKPTDADKKTNDALADVRKTLGLADDAALDDIVQAVKAAAAAGSDEAADAMAQNAAGGKLLKNGKDNPVYAVALEAIKAQPKYNRAHFAQVELPKTVAMQNAKKLALSLEGAPAEKKNSVAWWV